MAACYPCFQVRAAARVITGCPISTRKHALVAEAGQVTVDARRRTLAARFLAKARGLALPAAAPLRTIADATVPRQLSSVTGWREVEVWPYSWPSWVWRATGVTSPIEPAMTHRLPPWSYSGHRPGTSVGSRGPEEERGRRQPGRPATMRDLDLDRRFSERRCHQRRSRRADRVPRRRDS